MFIIHIEIGRKQFDISHHKEKTDEEIRKARIALKGNCKTCGKKITSLYRRTFCSTPCVPKNHKVIAFDPKRKIGKPLKVEFYKK